MVHDKGFSIFDMSVLTISIDESQSVRTCLAIIELENKGVVLAPFNTCVSKFQSQSPTNLQILSLQD